MPTNLPLETISFCRTKEVIIIMPRIRLQSFKKYATSLISNPFKKKTLIHLPKKATSIPKASTTYRQKGGLLFYILWIVLENIFQRKER